MAANQADPLRKAKEVEFTIQREAWGSYDLDGNVLLRARVVLIKLLRLPQEQGGEPVYAPSAFPLLDVSAPPKLRRYPPPPQGPGAIERAQRTEVQFRSTDEPWNEYIFEDPDPKLIKLKLVVTGVSRLEGLWDQFGMPVYHISHSTVVAPPVARNVNPGR